jgi:dihydrofolate synthase / folylpolyglutamate synthase
LDATNVVTPKVSVITSLSYDHMAVLGNTLAEIAGEKAGIIKEGVPVVSSPQKDEALQVLERVAKEKRSPFILVGKDAKFERLTSSLDGQSFHITDNLRHSTLDVWLPLLGLNQIENAATAYAALKTSGLEISDDAIKKGFAEVNWPARFQVVRREPPVIFDSAHNEDSFVKLRQTLEEHFPGRLVTLIFGASEDKNIPGMFAVMKPTIKRLIVTRADHPRALEPEKIIELAKHAGLEAEASSPVEAAFGRALELSEKDGSIVLSAGSMFVTAEVMGAWNKILSADDGVESRER